MTEQPGIRAYRIGLTRERCLRGISATCQRRPIPTPPCKELHRVTAILGGRGNFPHTPCRIFSTDNRSAALRQLCAYAPVLCALLLESLDPVPLGRAAFTSASRVCLLQFLALVVELG